MSYDGNLLQQCPELQQRLDDWYEVGDVGQGVIDEAMPALQFIMDNQTGLEMQISPGNSKKRRVQLLYDQFITEDQAVENVANPVCVATSERGNHYQDYEIDTSENLSFNERIPLDKFIEQCESNPDYFARVIQKLTNALDRATATKTVEEMQALLGAWNTEVGTIDGVTLAGNIMQVSTLNSSGGLANFTNQQITRALGLSLFSPNTLIVDGGQLTDYYQRMLAGCCADSGVNLGEMQDRYGFAVAYDKRIQRIFGNETGLAIQGGSLVLIPWTRAGWKDGVANIIASSSNYIQTSVVSPKTSVPYDVIVKDDCGVINITMVATTKLVSAPDDMFPTGTEYDGMKMFSQIDVVAP